MLNFPADPVICKIKSYPQSKCNGIVETYTIGIPLKCEETTFVPIENRKYVVNYLNDEKMILIKNSIDKNTGAYYPIHDTISRQVMAGCNE